MTPPKYKFYMGKAISFTMLNNTAIDPVTGQTVTSNSTVSSTRIQVNSKTVYINYSPSSSIVDYENNIHAESLNIHMYGSNSEYIGKQSVESAKAYILDKNTERIALEFISASDDIHKMHSNFIKSGFSEVYELQTINPYYKELSKKYSKESNQEFFRISLDGKINLLGNDYDTVYNSSLDDSFVMLIYKFNVATAEWEHYYTSKFNKIDCKLDYDRKKCELKLTPLDAYTKIMDNYENVYDLIKLAPEISRINLHKRSLMQVYISGANSITNFFGGTYWEDDVNEVVDKHSDLIDKYHFAYIKAGNEFYVKNAGIAEVNGVYAGTNGYWSQWNGYTCYMGTDIPLENAYIYIKRNSDNEILYRSEKQFKFLMQDNCYIDRDDIIMINVNDSSDRFVIESPFVYHIYRRLLCDVDSITDSEGTKNTYDLPLDDFVVDNKNYKKCIGISGGLFFCTSKAVDEPTKYGLNDYGQYFTDAFIPSAAGYKRPLPISRSSWTNASLWYVYDSQYELFEKELRKQYTLKNSYSIASAIKAVLNKVDPSIIHNGTEEYSKFLYAENNPLSADRFYVYITQKTNVLKGDYDQAAQKAEISLKSIMDMLRDCFRCYWYIDGNKLKIEHIRFFINGGSYLSQAALQLDFTILADQFNKKNSSYFQSAIEYDKSELSSRYEFGWMDNSTDLFGNMHIDVKANYIQSDKKEEISPNNFSSDVDFMLFNPSGFSNDGFALLCPIKNDSGELELPIVSTLLLDENKEQYGAIIQNWYASWAYLVNFYMYDMPAYNIDCDRVDLLVNSTKLCMKHDIEFPIDTDLDTLMLIRTNIGDGKIDTMSINLDTRKATVTLVYSPK